jgi:biotin carboxyl carrier protein
MKMKNIIRAPRAGQIAAVHVSPGQHVKHNDLLFEYAEA